MLCLFPDVTRCRVLERLNFAYRTNIFPEARCNPTAENLEIHRKLNDGVRILKLLKNAGLSVPVTAPQGKELTYVMSHSGINLTSYTGGEVPDEPLEALCCAYSSGALRVLIDSGVDVNSCTYKSQSVLKVIAENYMDYYDPAEMITLPMDNGANITPLANTWIGDYLVSSRYCTLRDMTKIVSSPEAKELIIAETMKHTSQKDLVRYSKEKVYDFIDSMHYELLKDLWEAVEGRQNIQIARGMKLFLASCLGSKKHIDEAIIGWADINSRTNYGNTPLIYASVFNKAKMVHHLIQTVLKIWI